MRRLFSLLLLPACLLAGPSPEAAPAPETGPLILISIDAFRWDYLPQSAAPTLQQLAQDGVHATRLNASFPTKTFPNHYTLVTGLRPEHHGIVSNYFFDPDLNASFNKNLATDNSDSRWWEAGEPIWITAEKQGVRTAVSFWPGSEAEIHGTRPRFYQPFDKKAVAADRVDALLARLDLPPAERMRFGAIYFDLVDIASHSFGPDSPETRAAVREADALIARLLAGLAARGLADRANVVVVSDHGMSATSANRVIFIEDLVDVSQVQVESTGPNGGVRPKPGTVSAAELAAAIRAKAPPQLHVYLREEVPAELHYRDNPRIPPVVLIADAAWMIESKAGWPAWRAHYSKGNHGWDPATPEMGALFIAHGPAFRPGVTLPSAENVDLYNLLCAVLHLTPAPNDGGDALVRGALRR